MSAIGEAVFDLHEVTAVTGQTATWKSKDCDHRVTVLKDLGDGPDGRHYVSVLNSRTGLPLDELEF